MTIRLSAQRLSELYTVLDLPVFQNLMFDSAEEARTCVRGDVNLVRDLNTGLIFNRSFRPELMRYTPNYQNEQAVSQFFQQHLTNVVSIIEKHLAGCSLIEVGCGKGHFLEVLQAHGFAITGMDPAYEGSNPAVIKEYFTAEVGLRAEGIVLRHVLEHVQDPVGFLRKIWDANGGKGKVYIEVPCFDWICEHKAWFDIFYEHVNYFRLSDFERIFGVVHEAGHIFSGQYLYVVADLASIREPLCSGADDFTFPSDFLATLERNAEKLKQRGTSDTAIWGGASKGVVFSLLMKRLGAEIELVVDVNPAKHGKYLPGTGLEVCSPERALQLLPRGASILVMNANYLQEIKKLTSDQFNYITVENDGI